MRAFRICGYCLLLLPLLGISGCSRAPGYTKKGAEVRTDVVRLLANCTADPDTAGVPKGDTLTWIAADSVHSYKVHFSNAKPIATADPTTGQGQPVTGDFACNNFRWLSESFCVYGYDLIVDGATCKDPGIHVVQQ
jgi:hypothetical protein